MKINPDCTRDLMLYFEEHTKVIDIENKGGPIWSFGAIATNELIKEPTFKKYSHGEICYHVLQLSLEDYISTNFNFDCDKVEDSFFTLGRIYYVTPKGHKLIASIADEKSWKEKIAPILNALGSISLSVIESIAISATSNIYLK